MPQILMPIITGSERGLFKLLNYEDLSSNKQVFVDWLATPEFSREIKTQRELADHLGVSEVTLSRWKQDNDIIRFVAERKRKLAGVELLPQVIDALAIRATKTNKEGQKYANKDAELFLKWYFGEEFGGGVDVNVAQINESGTSATKKLADKLAKMSEQADQ